MPYPHDLKKSGAGVNDNDVVLTTEDVSGCNEHLIRATAGTVDVEVAINDGTVGGATYTDSATFPISVMKLNVTNPSTWSLTIAAGEIAVLVGRFDRVRLRQNGATAAAAHISSYIR
jgi:hypothetical protein